MRRQCLFQAGAILAGPHYDRFGASLWHLAVSDRRINLRSHVPGEESYGHNGANRE